MDLNALKTVALVAQLGSLAAAARHLDMDPSSVSRILSSVEDRLGLRLFQRSTRRLAITEEGETYLNRVIPLLEEFDHARELAVSSRSKPAGHLRLTCSVAFGHECLVPYLHEFAKRFPDITLELVMSDSNLDLVKDNVDLAIRLTPKPQGDLINTRLMHTRYSVYATQDYINRVGPIREPADLESRNCLRYSLPNFRTEWQFRDQNQTIESVAIKGNILISNALALRQAARNGLGPALLADWLVRRDLQNGILVDLFPDHDVTATNFNTGAYALYPSRSYLPAKVRATIDFLREKLS